MDWGDVLLKHTCKKKCNYLLLRKVPRYDSNEGYCVTCEAAFDMNIIQIFQYNCPCCCCKIRTQPTCKSSRNQNNRKSKYQSYSQLEILPVLQEKRRLGFRNQR
jgi:hypothetical protein